jgi:hypothetical protein
MNGLSALFQSIPNNYKLIPLLTERDKTMRVARCEFEEKPEWALCPRLSSLDWFYTNGNLMLAIL